MEGAKLFMLSLVHSFFLRLNKKYNLILIEDVDNSRVRELLECPVCLEGMRPPKKIFQVQPSILSINSGTRLDKNIFYI